MKNTISIVVYDPDDPLTVGIVAEALKEYQSILIPCTSPEAVSTAIERQSVDVVVLNFEKPPEQAFRLLSEIQMKAPQAEVIFVAQFDDEMLWSWMEIIQRGAYEFLAKPLDPAELMHQVVRATEKHHRIWLQRRPPAKSVKQLDTPSKKKTFAEAQAWRLIGGN
jgi:two-component system C4-dicarboxylate transport response regulator DctD